MLALSSLLHLKVLFSLHYDLCRRGFVLKKDPLFSVNLDVRHGRRYLLKGNVYIKITCDRRNANFTLLYFALRLFYIHLFKRLFERGLDIGNRGADGLVGVVCQCIVYAGRAAAYCCGDDRNVSMKMRHWLREFRVANSRFP